MVNRTWLGSELTKHRRALRLHGSTDRDIVITLTSRRRSMQIIELHRVARKVFATCLVCYKMQSFLNLLIGLFADVTLKLMKNCRVYMNTYQMLSENA